MSLVATLVQPLRAKYNQSLDKNEVRPSRYGAWDYFNKDSSVNSGIFTPEIKAKIKASFGNSVQVPVMPNNSAGITIGNVRSCTIADAENNSALVTLTFITYVFGFTMYPAQYGNNEIAYQQDFERKLTERLIKFADTLDTQCITKLEAEKNIFWTGISGDPYTQTANSLVVSQALKNDFYNNVDQIMNRMDFYGKSNIITSPHHQPLVRRLQHQGAGNQTNEQFQLTPYDWYFTNRVVPGAGNQSAGYICQEGTVAVESRIDFDASMRHKIGDVIEWGSVNMPLPGANSGVTLATFYRKDCADGSALHAGTAGNTRTLKESFEFSVDMCFASAYNSAMATRFNPIVKFNVTTA